MVQLTQKLLMRLSQTVLSSPKKLRGTFLDKLHISIRAGNGGMGCLKYGGIGGKGGDVYMKATKVKDLRPLAKRFPERRIRAEHGGNSVGKQLLGVRGKDVILEVPCGIKAFTNDKLMIGEVNKVDEEVLLARGGIGGNPSTGFSGMNGQKLSITLQLSLISDVSLLGFPNAGKSTLLKACSSAKPRIAAYPFTTIKPNIGTLVYEDLRKITMADLPGLIEGAHANYGMGHNFLRHIERTSIVLMIIDSSGFQLSHDKPYRTAFETIMLLNRELELYDSTFLDKPMALLVNKMDLPGSHDVLTEIKDKLSNLQEIVPDLPPEMQCEKLVQFEEIIPLSAQCDKESVEVVKQYVRSSLSNLAERRLSESNEKSTLQELKQNSRESGPLLV